MKIRLLTGLFAVGRLCAAYQYYYNDPLTSINPGNWIQNGSASASASGLSSSSGGALISKMAVPDGSSSYEVAFTLNLTASGGSYSAWLRASSDALAANTATGTFYSVDIMNPTFMKGACEATLAVHKSVRHWDAGSGGGAGHSAAGLCGWGLLFQWD